MDKLLAFIGQELATFNGKLDSISTLRNPSGSIDAVVLVNRETNRDTWVTWRVGIDAKGNFSHFYWGNYYGTWEAASIDYQLRTKQMMG